MWSMYGLVPFSVHVIKMPLGVCDVNVYLAQVPVLSFGIQLKCDGGASRKAGAQQVVGCGPKIISTN